MVVALAAVFLGACRTSGSDLDAPEPALPAVETVAAPSTGGAQRRAGEGGDAAASATSAAASISATLTAMPLPPPGVIAPPATEEAYPGVGGSAREATETAPTQEADAPGAGRTATPWPVVITLDEAVATVESRSILGAENRVERAYFAEPAELLNRIHISHLRPPSALIVLEVAQIPLTLQPNRENGLPDLATAQPGDADRRFAVVMNPWDGSVLNSMIPLDAGEDHAAAIREITPLQATAVGLAPMPLTPPASPDPLPTLAPRIDDLLLQGMAAVPLTEGQVPRALVESIGPIPLLRGAWWRYRSYASRNDTVWDTRVFTKTVVRAVAIGEVAMLVELERSGDAEPLDLQLGRGLEDPLQPTLFALTQHGIHAIEDRNDLENALLAHPLCLESGVDPEANPIVVPLPFPRVVDPAAEPCEYGRRTEHYWIGEGPVTGPDQVWQDCLYLAEMYSQSIMEYHAYCEDIGFVKHSFWGLLQGTGELRGVWDLEDFSIPPLEPVP